MLKKFQLKNYKNFKDEICIDFENTAGYHFNTDCISNDIIRAMLIYGRNATGKTNLGRALMNIRLTIFHTPIYNRIDGTFLNADTRDDSATFSYTFQFDNKELIYRYARISDIELQNEELIIDGTSIYKFDFSNKEYHYENLNGINAETANVDRYLNSLNSENEIEEIAEPKIPFLRWLISNVAFENDSVLIKLANYIGRMIMITVRNIPISQLKRSNENFYESLEEPEKLQELEDFLNTMGIECKLQYKKLPDGQRELYFSHDKLVPFFENASSGTLSLFNLYQKIVSRTRNASLLYLDEFDAFYHYEMAENVVDFFKRKYPKCQMIMTSHNTNLMTNRLMRPDCLFILSGTGTLTALCNATERELREGHNLEKMYISGEFEKYE